MNRSLCGCSIVYIHTCCTIVLVVEQLNKYFNTVTPSFTVKRSSGNYTIIIHVQHVIGHVNHEEIHVS